MAKTSTTPSAAGGISVSITNSLTIPIDIYDVFNPKTASNPTPPYLYTKLQSIAPGATGTVTTIRNVSMLQAMTNGIIPDIDQKYYYQFPIKFMSGTQFSFGTPAPLTYTVTKDDLQSCIEAFKFHKFATANPSSALTSSLNTAVKTGDPDTINKYFAGTQNFKNCTFAAWNAIMTWLQQFTTGWQGPYYLYENPGSPLPQNYTPKLLATLNIKSDAQNNSATMISCTTDDNGNPVYGPNPQTTTLVMAGDGTLTDSNIGVGVSITLTPVWMNVIQTSMQGGVPVPSYSIGCAMAGTLGSSNVVSSQTARQLPGKPKEPKKQSSFDSIFGQLCQSVGLLVGLLMLYEFMTKKSAAKQEETEQAKADAKSEDDFKAKENAIEESTQTEIQAELTSPSAEATFATAPQVQESYAATSEAMQKDMMTQTMEEQAEKINSEMNDIIAEGGTPSQAFEDAADQLEQSFADAQKSIENGDFGTASTTLADASSSIETTIANEQATMAETEVDALNESSKAIDEAAKGSEALDTAQEDYENDLQSENNDSGYEADNEDPEVDPIPSEVG